MLSLISLVILLAADASAAPLSAQPLLQVAAELELNLKARHHAATIPAHNGDTPGHSPLLNSQAYAQVELSRPKSLRRSFGRYRTGHQRRDASQEGTPGFVEVATRLFHTNLAKSVAGLVFSAPSGPFPIEALDIGTSATQSSEFFMARSPNAINDTGDGQVVQLQIPLFDSAQLTTKTYCATFPTMPPCQLSLRPCGDLDGMSQDFAYNATSGQLQPLFQAAPAAPFGNETIGMDKLAMTPLVHDLLISQFDEQPAASTAGTSEVSATVSSMASDASASVGASTVLPSRIEMLASASQLASMSASLSPGALQTPTSAPKAAKMSLFFVAKNELVEESSSTVAASASASSSLQGSVASASPSLVPTMVNLAIKPESRGASQSSIPSVAPSAVASGSVNFSATPSVWSMSMPTIEAFAQTASVSENLFSGSVASTSASSADAACTTTVMCPI